MEKEEIPDSYSQKGKEIRITYFPRLCCEQRIEQRLIVAKNPKINGNAEQVIKTLMEERTPLVSSAYRKTESKRLLNFYNRVRHQKGDVLWKVSARHQNSNF